MGQRAHRSPTGIKHVASSVFGSQKEPVDIVADLINNPVIEKFTKKSIQNPTPAQVNIIQESVLNKYKGKYPRQNSHYETVRDSIDRDKARSAIPESTKVVCEFDRSFPANIAAENHAKNSRAKSTFYGGNTKYTHY